MLAITGQVLLVGVFICAILIDVFRSISNIGGTSAAQASMGFDSDVQIVWIVILLSFGMLVVQLGALLAEVYRVWHKAQAAARWSCCSLQLPTCHWYPTRHYSCFISHYKMEAASDARYIGDALRKMLNAPVFLDSATLAVRYPPAWDARVHLLYPRSLASEPFATVSAAGPSYALHRRGPL